jgi:hypothetical protein
MVVGPEAFGALREPAQVEAQPAARPDPPRRTAPLPDIAIDSLDEEVDYDTGETPPRATSAPTTENLDTGLADEAAGLVRTATEAGIRQAGNAELRLAAGRCPGCGAGLAPGDIFCITCGASALSVGDEPAPAAGGCAECGKPLHPGDIFCAHCGAAV